MSHPGSSQKQRSDALPVHLQISEMMIRDIAAGRLVPVLEAFNPGDVLEVHVVFLGQGGHLPARVRAFIDFLVENLRLPSWSPEH